MRLPEPATPFRGHYEHHYGDRTVEQLDDHVWRTTCFHPYWTTFVDHPDGPRMNCKRCGASSLSPFMGPTVWQTNTAGIVDAFLADLQGK